MTLVVLIAKVYYLVKNKYNPKICFSRVPNDPAHRSLVAFMEEKPKGIYMDISNVVAMESFLVVKCVYTYN